MSPLVVGSLVGAVILLALFVFTELRLREPLIELQLFANRNYLGANAVAFAQNFGFGALMFLLTLYLQYVLDYSPLETGLVFLAFTVTLSIFDVMAGPLTTMVSFRLPMVGGMVLNATDFLLLALITPVL
jgi:hypothetical protein